MRWASAAMVIFIAALSSAGAHAQTCYPLTGHWVLDRIASKMASGLSFNPFYAVDNIDLTLHQQTGQVDQAWRFTGTHLDEQDRYTVPTDGRSAATGTHSLLNSTPIEIRANWQNCTLVEDARTNLFGQTVWTRNSYVISPGNRQLSIWQVSVSDLGDVDRTLVFNRADAGDAK